MAPLEARIGHTLSFSGIAPAAYAIWVVAGAEFTFVKIDTTGDAVADLAIRFVGQLQLTCADFLGDKVALWQARCR